MGPSGAGKDTLMAGAGKRLPGRLAVAERLVTRPCPNAAGDRFVTREVMGRLLREGRLALQWSCHGFDYGIEKSIESFLLEGTAVLVNGSRGYFTEALALYPALKPVLVTAEPGILRARLLERAREGGDSIRERLLRTDDSFALDLGGIPVVDNSRDLEGALESFLGHISSWL
jgi:ribose 1,5-bisphosphokinase